MPHSLRWGAPPFDYQNQWLRQNLLYNILSEGRMHEQNVFHKVYHRSKAIDMKNWNMLMAAILLLTAAVFVTHSALAKEESMGMTNASLIASSNNTELVSFVESAVADV
jgi:hypothetical protein